MAGPDDRFSLRGLPVLVVDNLELDRKLLSVLLRNEGCEVETAASLAAAWRSLAGFRPRLVLLDVRLGNEDGLELAYALATTGETRDITVVAISAYDDHTAAHAAGCRAYIEKPIDIEAVLETLRILMARPQ